VNVVRCSPWRIVDDCGGAFAMGAIGGSVFHSIKGFRNAPSVSNMFVNFTHFTTTSSTALFHLLMTVFFNVIQREALKLSGKKMTNSLRGKKVQALT